MSNIALQVLVGTALTDHKFCEGLLNGSRRILLADFDLTHEEQQAILAIDATSIQEFAAHLCEWLEVRDKPTSRPATAMAASRTLQQPVLEPAFQWDRLGARA
jgi:hypothetical protein